MSGTVNTLAAALAAALAGDPREGRHTRELWERGGRTVYSHSPTPVTFKELRALRADDAATAARHITDPTMLARVWQSDGRVAVCKGILDNPHIGASTALAGITWLLDRGESFPFSLVERAGVDAAIDVLDAHPTLHDDMYGPKLDSSVTVTGGFLPNWAEGLGLERLRAVAARAWAAEVVGWVMANGVPCGFVTDDDVDELWAICSQPAQRFALGRLLEEMGLSRRWLERLDGYGTLCTLPRINVRYGPLPIEAPELLVGLCRDIAPGSVGELLDWFRWTEPRFSAGQNPDGTFTHHQWLPTEVGDALLELLATAGDEFTGCPSVPLEWLSMCTSAAAAPSFVKVLEESARPGWRDRGTNSKAVKVYLERVALGDSVVDVLTAALSTEVVKLWANGVYQKNLPTVELVADLVRSEPYLPVCEAVAHHPQLWGEHLDVAKLVVEHSEALGALVARADCPQSVIDALLARAEDRPITVSGSGWEANVVAAIDAARAGTPPTKIGIEPAKALLEHYVVPETLRVDLARQGGAMNLFCAGAFALNPVTVASLGDDEKLWATPSYGQLAPGQYSELVALASSSKAPAVLRARAAVRLGERSSLSLSAVAESAFSAAKAGPLDFELLAALSLRVPRFAGWWLAGGFEPNLPGDIAAVLDVMSEMDDTDKVTAAAAYAECCGANPDPAALSWIASLPGVLTATQRSGLMALVARIVQEQIGDDVDAWLLFAELGEDSPASVADVLDLVAATYGCAA